jgi:hypothetical protein
MVIQRCPMCRLISPGGTTRCDCGYVFGQTLGFSRALVRRQLVAGLVMIPGGLAIAGTSLALLLGGIGLLIGLGGIAGGVVMVTRGAMIATRSRRSLHELPTMPVARALPDRAGSQ